MGIRKYIYALSAVFLSILLLFASVNSVLAASGSISVQPLSGTFTNGESFDASIKIDGGGEAFNASKANISVSDSLKIESLTLGDCGFAFVDTPSTSSLSYAGVILGGSVGSCTVYTLKLKVVSGTNGFVFISDGSIKAYSDSAEIFSKVNNSSYSFGGGTMQQVATAISPTQAPMVSANNGTKYYTLLYGISTGEKSKSDLKVILDADQPSQMIVVPNLDSNDPTILSAVFDNVVEGVHTVAVYQGEDADPVSEEVVNVTGKNREISLGVAPKPSTSFIWYALSALVMIIIISAVVIGVVFFLKKRRLGQI